MILGIEELSKIQITHSKDITVRYIWVDGTDTPVPVLKGARIYFRNPNPGLWEHLMTSNYGGLKVDIGGVRNCMHDALDECYRPLLSGVNEKRQALGFDPVRI